MLGCGGGEGRGMGGVRKERGYGRCEEVWGDVWKSVWGECGKVCWGVGRVRGEVWGVWGKVRKDVGV